MNRATEIEDPLLSESDDELIIETKITPASQQPSSMHSQSELGTSDDAAITVMEEMPQPKTHCPRQCNYVMSQGINFFSACLGLGMLMYYGNDLLFDHVDRNLSDYLGIAAGGLHLVLGGTNGYYTEQIRRNQALIPIRMERKAETKISDNRNALHNNLKPVENRPNHSSSISMSNSNE